MMNIEEKEFEDMEWILATLEKVVKYAEDTGRSTIETGNLRAILNLDEKDDRCTCPGCRGDGAVYEQVRVGQYASPFVCSQCNGDGEIESRKVE